MTISSDGPDAAAGGKPRTTSARTPPAWLVPSTLSFVAAWIDTVGFVALAGLFTAHVTGNFVVIGAAIAATGAEHAGLIAKLAALPVFAVGVAATTLVVRRCEQWGASALRLVVLVEAALLAGFLVCGLAAAPVENADAPWALGAGAFALLAMGSQNAAGRLVFAGSSPTTVMTVNVTQAVIDCVDAARAPRTDDETGRQARQRLARLAPPIAAFAVGALAGALAWRAVGFACVELPVAALVAVAFARER